MHSTLGKINFESYHRLILCCGLESVECNYTVHYQLITAKRWSSMKDAIRKDVMDTNRISSYD